MCLFAQTFCVGCALGNVKRYLLDAVVPLHFILVFFEGMMYLGERATRDCCSFLRVHISQLAKDIKKPAILTRLFQLVGGMESQIKMIARSFEVTLFPNGDECLKVLFT